MERLSLFRSVSNAAESGFLSHTVSDGAETLLVGWTVGKSPGFVDVILCNQVSNTSEALSPMTPRWYRGFTKHVWKQQIIASRQKKFQEKGKHQDRKSHTWLLCPEGSGESCRLWCPGEEDFEGKPLEQSSCRCCWELLSRSILTCELVTLFPPLTSPYLLATFVIYSLILRYTD